jgi:WD40 repeat protein
LRGDTAPQLRLPNSGEANPPQAPQPLASSGIQVESSAKSKPSANVKPSTKVKASPKAKASPKVKASTGFKASSKVKASNKVKTSAKVKASAKVDNSTASAASNLALKASPIVNSIKDHRIGEIYSQIAHLRAFQVTMKQLKSVFPCPSSRPRVSIPCNFVAIRVGLHQMQKLITLSHLCVTLAKRLVLYFQGQWSKISSKDALRRATSILARRHAFRLPKGPPTCITTLESEGHVLSSVALHPFLPLLATGSYDKTPKMWLVNSNGMEATCIATLEGHKDSVSTVAFHPRLPLLVTGSHDNTAKFWLLNSDGTAATCTATLEGHTSFISSVSFHPHLPLLATGSYDQTAKLWMINSSGTSATCNATLGGHSHYGIASVAFHQCLPLLATICGDFSLKVWVMNSKGTEATCTASLKGQGFGVCGNFVSFHPSLPLFAAKSCDQYNTPNTVKLWLLSSNYTSATCAATLDGHKGSWNVNFVGFHPCLPLLAIRSNENTVKVWSLNSDGTAATCTSTLEGIIGNSDGTSGSLAFHPWLPLLASVTSSLQLSKRKRASPTRSTTFRFCFCPEPKPQMPVVRMLAGSGTHNGHTGTAAEHGGSGRWTAGGALFDSDSD